MTTAIENIKKHELINYNDILSNDIFGAITVAPNSNFKYRQIHNQTYHVFDKLAENKKAIPVIILEIYTFDFADWYEMLDVPLSLNTLHIDDFQNSLYQGYENFMKKFIENSRTITIRNICGYGDNAHNIIQDKIKLFQLNPRFHLKKKAALLIYKKI